MGGQCESFAAKTAITFRRARRLNEHTKAICRLPREYNTVFVDAERTPTFDAIWQQMRHAYLEVPLPVGLRELLLARFSHSGRSRFCRAVHTTYLLRGSAPARPLGDIPRVAAFQAIAPERVLELVTRDADPQQLAEATGILESTDERFEDFLDYDCVSESTVEAFLKCAGELYQSSAASAHVLDGLKKFLSRSQFAAVQTLLTWCYTEQHWAMIGGFDELATHRLLNEIDLPISLSNWIVNAFAESSAQRNSVLIDDLRTQSESEESGNCDVPPSVLKRAEQAGSDCDQDTDKQPCEEANAADEQSMQAALIESEARYRRFVDQTLDGTYRLDFDPPIDPEQPEDVVIQQMYDRGRIGDCNAAYARMYGFDDPQQMVGVTLKELHGGDDVPENVEAMREFVRAGFQHLNERTVELDRDGNTVHLINNSMGLFKDGRYECCWGTQTNITELVAAQETVRQHHELSEIAIDTSPNIVALLDPDGKIRRINPCLAEVSGWDEAEVIGRDWLTTFFAEEDRPQVQALFAASPSAEAVPGFFTRLTTRHGELRDIEWRCATMTDRAGRAIGLLCTGQDVTERKAMERHVLQASTDEQRRIAQDLHDGVGQQLTGLSMMADVLKRLSAQEDSAAESETIAEIAAEIAGGLSETLSQVRSLARGLYPVEIDPDGLSSALEELCRNSARVYNVDIQLTESAATSFSDSQTPTQLYRIAQEAIANAVRHGQPEKISVSLSREADRLCLQISNDGHPIPEATKRTAGLGLRSMNYRARMIGATLEITSSANAGTSVLCRTGMATGNDRPSNITTHPPEAESTP